MNRITTNKLLKIFLKVCIALVMWNVIIVNQELEDPNRIGKIIFFLWMFGPIVLVLIISLLAQGKTYLSTISVFSVLFMIYIFINGKNSGIWNNEKFLYFAGCLVVLLSISHLVAHQKQFTLNAIPVLTFSLIFTGLYEALYGLLQLYDMKSSFHANFKVTGTFFNPAPYSGYLVAVFPFALQIVIPFRKKV